MRTDFSSILQIWYVEVQIYRSISDSPLEFEITRVDCIWTSWRENMSSGVPIVISLEPKAQDELLWSLAVCRRPSVHPHLWTTFSETLGQFSSNFWSFLLKGDWKFVQMVMVRWSRWPPCPYMTKTLKNLLLRNQESFRAESWYPALWTQDLPSLFKWWPYVDLWLFYGKVKFASPCICMGKLLKNVLKTNDWNLQWVIKVVKHFSYNQNFVPLGLSTLAPGLYTCIKLCNF